MSFKLETDAALVLPKARAALKLCGHRLVVANLLQTRAHHVTLVDLEVSPPLGALPLGAGSPRRPTPDDNGRHPRARVRR